MTTPHAKSNAREGDGVADHLAVLDRLRKALPTVGLNGWVHGVKALDWAIAELTAMQAQQGAEPVAAGIDPGGLSLQQHADDIPRLMYRGRELLAFKAGTWGIVAPMLHPDLANPPVDQRQEGALTYRNPAPHAAAPCGPSRHVTLGVGVASPLPEAAAAVEKLQAFKDYVHQRLDAMGVPVDPESPHKAEGCRVGGRLDYIEAALAAPTGPQPAGGGVDDAARLDALRDNSWDLRCFNTDGGEDIAWEVIEHHMASPHERRVAVVYADDPRKAIDAAIKGDSHAG